MQSLFFKLPIVARSSGVKHFLFSYKNVPSVKFYRTPAKVIFSSNRAPLCLPQVLKRNFSESIKNETVQEGEVIFTTKPDNVKEKIIEGSAKKHEFQAETRKILDIVVRSLYSDREVFVRELISNASDALEKVRLQILSGKEVTDPSLPLEISVQADKTNKTLTIQDNGIGMSEQELVTNLGRIGYSGSAEFLKNIEKSNSASIIGQFGVGFYSAFMVASKITVYSRSAHPDSKGYCWVSDGTGSYEISEAEGVQRGTKIVISLNTDSGQFAEEDELENIIKKYSNFVGFDIRVNGKLVNMIKALWTLPKEQISDKEHAEFYKFIAHAYTDPQYHLHYTTDSPISIRALLYVGQQNPEKFGLGRTDSGVNLFSRKVLIQAKSKSLLPDWLRFIKGVVDSDDLPLNISREFLQDSSLIRRIKSVLTRRILKWLSEETKKDPKKYDKFFEEFGSYFKEGICSDFTFKEEIAKLLRFESSKLPVGEMTSFDDYISRMNPDQKRIFYLCAPSREMAEASPYYEGFKAADTEVLFMYSPLDDFVMTNNLIEYKENKIISAESGQGLPMPKPKEDSPAGLSDEETEKLIKWMKETLEGKVAGIKSSIRLVDSPCVIVGHDSTAYRRMMKLVDPQRAPALQKQQLEINPKHPVIMKLYFASSSKPKLAKTIADQLYDNALIAAGLVDDARIFVGRMNTILQSALDTPSDI